MDSLCRVCIKRAEKCTSLNSTIADSSNLSFLDFLNKCTSLNAREGDGLPQSLCLICANSMERFYAFVKLAEKCDEVLKEVLKNLIAEGRYKGSGETSSEEITISNVKIEEESEDDNQGGNSFHCQQSENSSGSPLYILDIVKEESKDGNPVVSFHCQPSENSSGSPLHILDIVKEESEDDNQGGDSFHCRPSENSSGSPLHILDIVKEEPQLSEGTSIVESKNDAEINESEKIESNVDLWMMGTEQPDYVSSLMNHRLANVDTEHIDFEDGIPISLLTKRLDKNEDESDSESNSRRDQLRGRKSRSKRYLNHHLGYEKEIVHKCDQCDKTFKNASSLKYHIMWHAQQNRFSCEKCGKMLTNKFQFDRHTGICKRRKNIQCQICGKILCSKQYLKSHMDMHTGITHKCDQCHKIFENVFTLRQHRKTHATTGKPFNCEYCGKCYAVRSWCCGFLIKTHDNTY